MGWWALHVPRAYVRGTIQALKHSCSLSQVPCSPLNESIDLLTLVRGYTLAVLLVRTYPVWVTVCVVCPRSVVDQI